MDKFVFDRAKVLKGGLHSHSTRSDGENPPEELVRIHAAHGYDFLAVTDHRVYNYKNFAPETGVLILPAMEYNSRNMKVKDGLGRRCFHILCYGPSREEGNGYEQDEKVHAVEVSGQDEFQATLDLIHQKKNITVYCHPEWSATAARHFDRLQGNFAMEIWNSGCAIENDIDKDAAYWDEMLGLGHRIWGVATDDGHYTNEHCNGWVMVNAEKNINSILEALQKGDFYSSCGPDFYSVRVEDGTAFVDCSPVAKIRLHNHVHPTCLVKSESGDLTHAEFDVKKYDYFRITIIDKDGKFAWSNPIFLV